MRRFSGAERDRECPRKNWQEPQEKSHEKLVEEKGYKKWLDHPWIIFLAVLSLLDLLFAFWWDEIFIVVYKCIILAMYWGLGYLVYRVVKKLKK